MIRLWSSTETAFRGNRWVLNETTKCDVTEVVNGEFAVDLEYPLKDTKDLSKNFLRGNLITCPVMDDRPEQQFRIRKVDKSSTGVTVYAQAKLIADLGSNYIRPITLTGLTRKQAIQAVLNAALEPHPYSVGTLDLSYNNNVIVNIPEGTVLNALIGKENSVLSEYGGEFIINNNKFDIVDSRGANRKFRIAYAKNIASIKETIDDTDLATVLIPKSSDYRLPEYVIESPKVANYEKRYFQEVDMNLNIWDGTNEKGDDQITLAEAYTIMRNTCNNMFLKDKVDQVAFNYEIDLISLRKTEEYKHYNIVEKMWLGDTVTVDHKLLNVDLEGKVNKTIYNVLLDKYNGTEIGFTKQDITDIIKIAMKTIKFTKDEILLNVNNSVNNLNTQIDIQDGKISAVVESYDGGATWQLSKTAFNVAVEATGLKSTLDLQATKISAVVESNDGGMTWTLKEDSFVVACKNASGQNVTIDINGLTINDGKLFLKNSSGDIVFEVDLDGICNAIGGFIVKDSNTETKINADGIRITNADGYTGLITVAVDYDRLDVPGSFYVKDFITDDVDIKNDAQVEHDLYVDNNLLVSEVLNVHGDLDVDGTKNCLQSTDNYGKRRISAYETAEYYFGDLGFGTIKNGECIVCIDDVFSECINTDINYQVDIFEYTCRGSITDVERHLNYFIVKGNTNDIEFGWELKAKRKGYENNRLDQRIEKENTDTRSIENILLENINTNLENILLESSNTNLEDILLEEVA